MRSAHGHVRQIRKLLSQDTCIAEVEFPVEHYRELVALLDGEDVLVIPRAETAAPEMPYGPVDHEIAPAEGGEDSPAAPSVPQPVPSSHPPAGGIDPRPWSALKPSAQAALRCKEPDFWAYMETDSELRCIDALYADLGIASRAELNTSSRKAEKWRQRNESYRAWLKYRDYPEARTA